MEEDTERTDTDPITVRDWFSAIVHTPSRADIALALIPLALVFGVLLGETPAPTGVGIAVGAGIALAAMGYALTVAAPG